MEEEEDDDDENQAQINCVAQHCVALRIVWFP